MKHSIIVCCTIAASLLFAGCQSDRPSSGTAPKNSANAAPATRSEPAAVVVAVAPATPAPVTPPVSGKAVIRIKAGVSSEVKDAAGNVWLVDQGFEGGDVIERPDLQIANTSSPEIYRAERYAMDSFSCKLPNGKYQVKLHFAETFEGITGPGERVFSFNVEGQEFKDFDVWKKAGGGQRAYVEVVNVEIADGKLDIKFVPNIENPEINGLEIIPAL